jgi:hypothetical protein
MAPEQVVPIDGDIDLGRLGQIVLPKDSQIDTGHPPNAKWIHVLRLMQAAISHRQGDSSVSGFLNEVRTRYKRRFFALENPYRVLQAVATVLYDQECSGEDPNAQAVEPEFEDAVPGDKTLELAAILRFIFPFMLSIDYGLGTDPMPIPPWTINWVWWRHVWPSLHGFSKFFTKFVARWRRGQVLDWKGRGYLNERFATFESYSVEDMALLLYYYHTSRREVDPDDFARGVTGYTGVVQKMIEEIPSRGTDRLARKLSADVNRLIPKFVQDADLRRRILPIAEGLAARHNIPLHAPEANFPHQDKKSPAAESTFEGRPYTPRRQKLKVD